MSRYPLLMQKMYLGQAIGMKSQREPVASGVSSLQGSVEREQGVTPGHRAHPGGLSPTP